MTTATDTAARRGADRPALRLWLGLLGRLVLPSVLGITLLFVVVLRVVLPTLEDSLMDRKRELLRAVTQSACSALAGYDRQVQAGRTTRAAAQAAAVAFLRDLRYGDDGKDYIWVTDMQTRMVMHPYQPQLDGQDMTEYTDPQGTHLFVEFTRVARESGGGYVHYLWQWKDDPGRVAAKLSYVQRFEPWDWVVGTGLYVDDVGAQIQAVTRRLAWLTGGVLAVVALLSGYVAWGGYRAESRRRAAELRVQRMNEELEERVQERTAKLAQVTRDLRAEIEEREQAEEARRALHTQLIQAQRLESVGQLAAGIAHEINTPAQFVSDNTQFLRTAFPKLADVLSQYQRLADACRADAVSSAMLDELEGAVKRARLDYMLQQIPEALTDSLEGLDRVTKIVRAMKDFARPHQKTMAPADLNKAIESTVTVARSEWKYVADVELDLDPDLPPVPCLLADFNQVVLNIVVNAAHAIKNVVGEDAQRKGTITISTRQDGDYAEIRVRDTGTGIPVEHRDRIFDHFFTTKEVGKGTGQGLAIARQVIVERHRGSVTFETEVGRGTTFIIRLPTRQQADEPVKVN